jgi:Domain of unknown function DUF11
VRRTILLLSTMPIAVLAVSGVMLFGMGKPALSQSDPEPPCGVSIEDQYCIDKTADPNPAIVGQPITFTITQRCPGSDQGCIALARDTIVDELPSGLTVESVDPAGCTTSGNTTSGNTVTCAFNRFFTPTQPFTLTIVATPTKCGTFTNTASAPTVGFTAHVTFTVNCVPTTKADCKKGGWMDFGIYPDQGTCISDVNRRNR